MSTTDWAIRARAAERRLQEVDAFLSRMERTTIRDLTSAPADYWEGSKDAKEYLTARLREIIHDQ